MVDSSQPQQRPRRRRAPGAYLALPLWARFALTIAVTLALLVPGVIYVNNHNTNSNPSLNEASEVRANREAEILVAEDQAPHSLQLAAGEKPAVAVEHAIRHRIASQISAGAIDGPLQRTSCRASGSRPGGRVAFSCEVVADSVTYPFLGVVDTRVRRVTYCKRDPPPAPTDNVPVSPRCVL
ncbi:MAG: hypothetical protein ACLPTJ_08065 [Solirubrobacteraceae bacterium]